MLQYTNLAWFIIHSVAISFICHKFAWFNLITCETIDKMCVVGWRDDQSHFIYQGVYGTVLFRVRDYPSSLYGFFTYNICSIDVLKQCQSRNSFGLKWCLENLLAKSVVKTCGVSMYIEKNYACIRAVRMGNVCAVLIRNCCPLQ